MYPDVHGLIPERDIRAGLDRDYGEVAALGGVPHRGAVNGAVERLIRGTCAQNLSSPADAGHISRRSGTASVNSDSNVLFSKRCATRSTRHNPELRVASLEADDVPLNPGVAAPVKDADVAQLT